MGLKYFQKVFLLNFRYNFCFRCGPIFQIPKSNRKNIFYTATQRKKFTVRIVQRYKIEEIESLDNR